MTTKRILRLYPWTSLALLAIPALAVILPLFGMPLIIEPMVLIGNAVLMFGGWCTDQLGREQNWKNCQRRIRTLEVEVGLVKLQPPVGPAAGVVKFQSSHFVPPSSNFYVDRSIEHD